MNSVLLEEKAMSKDMLGSVVRAAVGVPQDRLDLLAKIASKFTEERPTERSDGEVWHAYFKKLTEQGLPASAYLLDVLPTVVELGTFVVSYNEAIKEKLCSEAARALMYSGEYLNTSRHLSEGKFKRAKREGIARYKASVVSFNTCLTKQSVEEWCRQNKKIMAGPQEGVEVVTTTPIMKVPLMLPLIMFGECRYDHQDYSYTPAFRNYGSHIKLEFERFDDGKTPTLWSKNWKFLALEELQPVAA